MPRGTYIRTPEMNAAMSKAKMGHSTSDEARAKLSEARKGMKLPLEWCAAISKASMGENNPMFGKKHSPETLVKMSEAKMGVPRKPFTPEHCAAISKAMQESESVEAQRGGQDIVEHHVIYDHNDLSLFTIPLTRSAHSRLHALFRKLEIEIPHINMEA